MASTENLYVGDGSTVLYSFTFPYINPTDVKVSFNGTDTTEYSLANATTVELVSAPPTGTDIRIYRETDTSDPVATFYPGSAIRAQDLNDNFVQTVYAIQEVEAYVDGADAVLVKDTADQALADATVALAAATDAQTSANAADAKADNALVVASTKVDLTSSTGSAVIPSGSTAERDVSPQEGYLRYNTVTDQFEGYTNAGWSSVGSGGVGEAPIDGNQYARQDAGWSVVTGGSGSTTINYNGASAWAQVAENGSVTGALNIAGVTRTGAGKYLYTFATPMPNANYSVIGSVSGSLSASGVLSIGSITANGFTVTTKQLSDNGNTDKDHAVAVFSSNALPPKGGTGTDAWATCQADGTIDASFNIDSVVRSEQGRYLVTFTTPMPDTNYLAEVNVQSAANGFSYPSNKTVNGFLAAINGTGGGAADLDFGIIVHATNATLPSTFTVAQFNDLVARVTALENP